MGGEKSGTQLASRLYLGERFPWLEGSTFGATPNQITLAAAVRLGCCLMSGDETGLDAALSELDRLDAARRAIGLYSIPDGPKGTRGEARVMGNHTPIWYSGWGLLLHLSQQDLWAGREADRLRVEKIALGTWGEEIAWCEACATPSGEIVAPGARAYEEVTVPDSRARDGIYRLVKGIKPSDDRDDAGKLVHPDSGAGFWRVLDPVLHRANLGPACVRDYVSAHGPGRLLGHPKPRFNEPLFVARTEHGHVAWCAQPSAAILASNWAQYDAESGASYSREIPKGWEAPDPMVVFEGRSRSPVPEDGRPSGGGGTAKPRPKNLERRLLGACSAVTQKVRQGGLESAREAIANLQAVMQEVEVAYGKG